MSDNRIIQVNFTYACPDGMWCRRADGSSRWEHFDTLRREVGDAELARLRRVAYANGWTGMWYYADSGRHVYVDGVEVPNSGGVSANS